MFCDRLVSLLTESDRRPDYGAVVPCMKDIELAAGIAGRSSETHARRSELFFHAANAYARIAHEEQDNRPYLELIKQLREYRDQSKKFGANAYTNCLDGVVSLEEAFREVTPKTAFDLHGDAIAKFSNAISSSGSDKHVFLSLKRRKIST